MIEPEWKPVAQRIPARYKHRDEHPVSAARLEVGSKVEIGCTTWTAKEGDCLVLYEEPNEILFVRKADFVARYVFT